MTAYHLGLRFRLVSHTQHILFVGHHYAGHLVQLNLSLQHDVPRLHPVAFERAPFLESDARICQSHFVGLKDIVGFVNFGF